MRSVIRDFIFILLGLGLLFCVMYGVGVGGMGMGAWTRHHVAAPASHTFEKLEPRGVDSERSANAL